MSTGSQIYDKAGSYFLTFQVVDWVDIFTRKVYRDIILDSFDYSRKHKGLQIGSYVIMSNHVHCILSAKDGNLPDIIRDFKRHTASKIKDYYRNKRIPMLSGNMAYFCRAVIRSGDLEV